MKNFIKQNLVLVTGLTLPLLLIVLFFAATVIPKMMGTPPQYDMLFTTMHYDYQNPPDYLVDFSIKNQQVIATIKQNAHKDSNRQSRKLMVFDAKSETVREIPIDIVNAAKLAQDGEVLVAETKSMVIDASSVSPDGYMLEGPNYAGSGLMSGIFGGGYRNSGYRIKKGSVGYPVPNTQQHYYNQIQLIGWVTKK